MPKFRAFFSAEIIFDTVRKTVTRDRKIMKPFDKSVSCIILFGGYNKAAKRKRKRVMK